MDGSFRPVLVLCARDRLFNVFPLPRQRDFQRSFAHAGEALDAAASMCSFFPEGARSDSGALGGALSGRESLLVKQSGTAVLHGHARPGRLEDEAPALFRSGAIEVRVGQPVRFSPRRARRHYRAPARRSGEASQRRTSL